MSTTEQHEEEIVEVEERPAGQHLPAVRAHEAMVAKGEVSVDEVVAQRDKIREVMARVMVEGVHYGKIPGVDRPTLLKPGAEVLNVTFRFAPSYHSERIFGEVPEGGNSPHLTVISRCVLTHAPSGLVLGEGEGLCTTYETKYGWRTRERACPACGAEAIKKSKFSPREGDYPGADPNDPPGWYCFAKIGGCGVNFPHDDPAIIDQEIGKKANPDLADQWNTVLKMGDKRALVAAILNCTAASDIFTQDVEDNPAAAGGSAPAAAAEGKIVKARSWTDWSARMAAVGVPVIDSAEWLRQAAEGIDAADKEARATMFQKANRALLLLSDNEFTPGDLAFAADPRPVIAAAFAAAFGKPVEGPEWKIGPGEDRLTHAELEAARAQAGVDVGPDAPAGVDPEEVEFGS